jgi:hypothetical protein
MSDAYQLETFVKRVSGRQEAAAAGTRHLPAPSSGDPARRTSTRCRDADKQQAIQTMENLAQKMGVSSLAIMDAVELFARERNHLERMVHKRLYVVACLYACHVNQKRRGLVTGCVRDPPKDAAAPQQPPVKRRRRVSPMDRMSMYM